jgi:hypothetical protein
MGQINEILDCKLCCGLLEKVDSFTEIKKEVINFIENNKPSHVNTEEHGTYWTNPFGKVLQFNLLHPHGKYEDFSNNSGIFLDQKYPHLTRFVQRWADDLISFRINILNVKSGLSQHKETIIIKLPNGKIGLKTRFHLPIQTNKSAKVFLDGSLYHLEEGNVYYFNNSCVHSASNLEENRVHLVWDTYLSKNIEEYISNIKNIEEIGSEPIDENYPIDGNWDYKKEDVVIYEH